MTISENDNPALAGTENAKPSAADTSNEWDYFDPDEDQDNETAASTDEIENEVEEAADVDAMDDEPATDEESGGEVKPKAKDDIKVVMPDGSELALAEVKSGYLRQADYSRKTLEVAEKRKGVEALADRIERTVQGVAQFLANQIPEEPPLALSMTDPQAYVHRKATYDAVVAQVNALIQMGAEPSAVKSALSQEDQSERLTRENEMLVQAFPETKKPEARQAFFEKAFSAARQLGFTDVETKSVVDHRHFALAYWAAKGMAADKALATAKAKVKNAPPIAAGPTRQRTAGQAAQNTDAMRRLSKTGSIRDALSVDFD